MDRICQYSTIIFAGNVTVLCIVAVTTDYWEHRGFNFTQIRSDLARSNRTVIYDPSDTSTYIEIHYKRHWKPGVECSMKNTTLYQPPAYAKKFWCDCNCSQPPHMESRFDIIVLYEQYGNLFRECDNLEADVRRRVGIINERPTRCWNFISSSKNIPAYFDVPSLIHLERAAFLCAVISLVGMMMSLVMGAYGSLTRIRGSVVTASYASLVSGICLTFAIAIFHGKCYLLQRRPFMADEFIPFKSKFNKARTYSFGWSFVVSWICVFLCFVESWIWLHKAQHMKEKQEMHERLMKREQRGSEEHITHETYYTITYIEDT